MNSVTMDSSNPNVAPVFRFFSTSNGTNFFTTNVDERNAIFTTQIDLVQEQVNFADNLTPEAGDTAVNRFLIDILGIISLPKVLLSAQA